MKHLLKGKGLWGHVDGTDAIGADAGEQAVAEFNQKAQRALSTIVLAIYKAQL